MSNTNNGFDVRVWDRPIFGNSTVTNSSLGCLSSMAMAEWAFIEFCSYSTLFFFRNILSKVENLERFKLFDPTSHSSADPSFRTKHCPAHFITDLLSYRLS